MHDEERSSHEAQHLRLLEPADEAEPHDGGAEGVQIESEPVAPITEEALLWSGQPSLLLAVVPCTCAVLLLLWVLVSTHGLAPWHWGPVPGTEGALAWLSDGRLWALPVFVWCARVVLALTSEKYVLTASHLRVSAGIRVRHTSELEIGRLMRVQIEEIWPLRWLGLADVEVAFENAWAGCQYCQRPYLVWRRMRAVPGGEALRQKLYQARARFR